MWFDCPICGEHSESIEIVCTGGYERDTNAGPFYEVKTVSCGHVDDITPEQYDELEIQAHRAHEDHVWFDEN